MSKSIFHSQLVGLTNPTLKYLAGAIADAAILALHRAVAHTADPRGFPLPRRTGAFEHVFASLVRKIPADRLVIAQAKVRKRDKKWLS